MSRNRNFNDGRQRSGGGGPVLNQGRGLLGEAPSVHSNFGPMDRGPPGVPSNFRPMDRGAPGVPSNFGPLDRGAPGVPSNFGPMDRGVPGASSNFRQMDRGASGVASNFAPVDRGGTVNMGLFGNPQTSQGRMMALNMNQGMMNQSGSGRMDNKSLRDNQLQMVSELLKQQQQLQQRQQSPQQMHNMMGKIPAGIMGNIPTGLIGSGGQGLLGNFSNLMANNNMMMTSSGNRNVGGIMGNPTALSNRNKQNIGNWSGIPSIFELQMDRTSGKRPGGFSGGSDNKRMRRGHSPDNQRGRFAQDNRRRNSDHHPDGRRDRNRDQNHHHSQDRQDRSRDHSSESYKQDRDKKDTSVYTSSQENVQRKVTVEVEDVVIGNMNLEQKEDNDGMEEYDPASPTGDVEQSHDESQQSDENVEDMYAEFEIKKAEIQDNSDSVKVDIEMKDKATSGLTVTFDKKGRSVQDPDKKPDEKKEEGKQINFVCHACNISCYNEKSFTHHMKGVKHKKRMEDLMNMHKQKSSQMFARLKAESHLRRIENESTGNDGRVRRDDNRGLKQTSDQKQTRVGFQSQGSFKHPTSGHFPATRFSKYSELVSSPTSQTRSREAWPRCNLCNQFFKSPRKFVQHCKTPQHAERRNQAAQDRKNNDEELSQDDIDQLVTVDTVGYEDESLLESPEEMEGMERTDKAETEKKVTEEGQNSQEFGTKDGEENETLKTDVKPKESDFVIPENYDPNVPVGQKYVIPVSGFFCKLCHKFYNNENAARVAHCQSEGHFEKYKKAMLAKVISRQLREEAILKEMQMDSDTNIPQSDITTVEVRESSHSSQETTKEVVMKNETMSPIIIKMESQSPKTKNTEEQGSQESVETEGNNGNASQYNTALEATSLQEDNVEEEEEGGEGGEQNEEDIEEAEGNSQPLGKGRGRGGKGRGRRGRRGRK